MQRKYKEGRGTACAGQKSENRFCRSVKQPPGGDVSPPYTFCFLIKFYCPLRPAQRAMLSVQVLAFVTVGAFQRRSGIGFGLVLANDLRRHIHRQQGSRTGYAAAGTGHAFQ